ncbi:MAG: hypothetical protein A2W91_19870 [Bacteroidetes bacterium GWF2_38_335]|nr:MAG: hypothetical protein A2W91_19870 [Bacteroidetes bacterium GWF2_38_335]OFY82020.1 MAG: hypothetical protein A2281_10050 [Bacteroidetes bacterium RIFOXYA12_FULL_38_20]HBS86477.1 hypothetical protein [Bacteroidales bacterium]
MVNAEKKQTLLFACGFVLIFSLLSIFSYRNSLNEFPKHLHSWSQSDRYALALGYVDNGLDFFYPATYNLRPQEDFIPVGETGITGVDMPIHEYLIALVMKVTGSTFPVIFRMYNLLYGLLGLFFLGLLVKRISKNYLLAYVIPVFVFLSPVYHYYLNGFIPSVTSVSSIFIAAWFFYRYFEKENPNDFIIMVLFLCLAVIPRFSFIIFVPAFAIPVIMKYYKLRKINIRELVVAFSGLLLIVAFYLWKRHLSEKFGSGFLSGFMPAENFGELKSIIGKTLENWKFQYFTSAQYIFILLMVSGYFIMLFTGLGKKNSMKISLYFPACLFCAAIFYSILMARQYADHDYYFLDSFFPAIVLFLAMVTGRIQFNNRVVRYTAFSALIILLGFSGFGNSKIQELRRTGGDWDRATITAENFEGSDKLLDSLGISRNDKILVIDAYTSNTALILMDRKGWAILNTRPETIKKSLEINYDFVVMQDRWILSDVVNSFSEILNRIERVGGNGKISVYKPTKEPQKLMPFLGIDRGIPVFSAKSAFDNPVDTIWKNNGMIEKVLKKDFYGYVNRDLGYGATLKIDNDSLFMQNRYVLFSGKFYLYNKNKDFRLVFQLNEGEKTVIYDARDIRQLVPVTEKWYSVSIMIPVPEVKNNASLSVYITNKQHGRLCYDDFKLELY